MTTFLELAAKRFSCRAYKPETVPREMVEQILEAARLAPSACNRQPWRFAVATEAATRRRLVEEGFLPGLGMKWAADAPVLLVMGMAKSFITHTLAPAVSGVEYPLLDLGIAGEHAVLQATELGLGSCWIGWINPKAVRKLVGWPATIVPQAIITIGWPAAQPARPRVRMSTSEMTTFLD
jgi:nitroreductase